MKKTTVYAASVGCLADAALYEKAMKNVPLSRREKLSRYHYDADKYLSLGAFTLLWHALTEKGVRVPPYFSLGENGKPYIDGSPLFFNLSHSADCAMCAVSYSEVGCDIERLAAKNEMKNELKIAKRFFTEREYEYIVSAPTEEEQMKRFFCRWTLGESFVKATGQGMHIPLTSFSFEPNDDAPARIRQSYNDKPYRFETYDGIEGYAAAVCVTDDSDIEWRMLDLQSILS